jgi:nucleoside 2-deoxyribosyltransferase
MEPGRESSASGGDGRIPFTFRIGVTGHRDLADPDALRAPIREALLRLTKNVPVAPGAGLALVVVSALAEGADRLVAQEVLADFDARLEVALPMAAGAYAEDFKTEASKQEFRCLLAQASDTWQVPGELDREAAYERAGRYMVDRCDVIIAVWDGEKSQGRGGTAEIVGYAQEHGTPIAWVHTKGGPPAVSYALQNRRADVVKEAADKLRMYNTGANDVAEFDEHLRELRKELMPDMAREIPLDPLGLSRETVAGWVFPYFIRADILALRYQRRFRRLSWGIFALAAAAVAVVAMQANF